ncbi:histone-lysine N-methyltransferase EHMT1 isoform X1 [Gadus morhua]|uniref:Euchromatic histone-lysine N-methyltransferase 1b n=2 Tax=Gadus morhua TaxID=8049 RepID=A0A8C5FFH6_GADMO|nr:histone-lysine N-methyltransferase EHMT1 isoform X1 [Gadus morhua]
MDSVGSEPTGLAKGGVGKESSITEEEMEPPADGEMRLGRDHEAASRLSPSSRPETLLNGMELDHGPKSATHCFSAGPVSFISGNGTSHLVAPHGSVVGSNGFILDKRGGGGSTDGGISPCRTNWLPPGATLTAHSAKSPPPPVSPVHANSSDAWQSDGDAGIGSGRRTPETTNVPGLSATSTGTPPPPVTIHRARKTMSRPAVSLAQKLLNRERREAHCVRPEVESVEMDSHLQPPLHHQLPQSPEETTPCSAPTTSSSPATPSPQAPTTSCDDKIPLASQAGVWNYRRKKRKMGTYTLIPKKKRRIMKQRSIREMYRRINKPVPNPQPKEEKGLNGERMENSEDESEEMYDWDEEEQDEEENGKSSQDLSSTSEPVSQGEDQETEDSVEEEGEEDDTESDLSSESSQKKKKMLKKKIKPDSPWLIPSRILKKTRVKGPETQALSQASSLAQADSLRGYTKILPKPFHPKVPESLLPFQNAGVSRSSAVADCLAQEIPLCSCRMETPKSREILILADRKCMATESVDGLLLRCQAAALKHEMMRPANTLQLLVLCDDHRAGMFEHQCCPGCGFFCRAGTFMECQPDLSISHRFHRACASVLKGHSFCPHCGEEAGKAKEVTIAKADTTSTVALVVPQHQGPPTPGALEGRADTTTADGSSSLVLSAEPGGRADSSLCVGPGDGLDRSAPPGWPRMRPPLAGPGVVATPTAGTPLGPPKDTLETILQALDMEKPKKLRFHPKQLYTSAKQAELKKVVLMLVDGIDPNFKMEAQNKRTPLHAAAETGHEEICHMLVQAGANLDMCDEDQRTPLMEACEGNHMETARYLLRAGASVTHKDVEGFTCLHLAAKSGHYRVVEYLLSTQLIDINCQDDGGWTAMIWATEYKHLDQVRLLLSKGADVSIRDKEENICLHWAAFSGSVEISQLLIKAHGELHAVNIHGDSPLHIAARENRVECVMLFLSQGANVYLRNREGETPLDCCGQTSKAWLCLQDNRRQRQALNNCPPEDTQKVLNRDVARGHERVPIPCVNSEDGQTCPENYKYIPVNCVTSPMNIDRNITHLQYCVCKEDCSSSVCMCGQLSLRCWYDKAGRLLPEFCREEPPLIFECNHACSCRRTCKNRVVQNGLRIRLQLFRTPKKGWGVRALQDIPQGTFICEYVGEIISEEEAEMRKNDTYLFSMDNKPKDVYCIDAHFYGNISRFINHMCEPNLFACRVFTSHQDLRFPHIAFFACENIKAGEELGFNYGELFWEVKRKQFSCECGSPKCRYSSAALALLQADSTPGDRQQPSTLPDTSSSHGPAT